MEQGTASSVVGKTCTEIVLPQIKYARTARCHARLKVTTSGRCIMGRELQAICPPFATTMCDKFLAEEFVEVRLSFNGEQFYKSSYHVLSKAAPNRFIPTFDSF